MHQKTASLCFKTCMPCASGQVKIARLFSVFLLIGPVSAENEWQPLFNGKDLSNWESFLARPDKSFEVPGMERDEKGEYISPIGENKDPLGVFKISQVDGEPAIHVSGQGYGTITTKQSFKNFDLKMEFKWGEKRWPPREFEVRDCGLLYAVHGPLGGLWNTWPKSVEFQIQEGDTGDLWTVGTRATALATKNEKGMWIYDPNGKATDFELNTEISNRCMKFPDAEKPSGQWNLLEMSFVNGDATHIVNGVVVLKLTKSMRLDGKTPQPLTEGKISLQTEGAEVFYRKIEIRDR